VPEVRIADFGIAKLGDGGLGRITQLGAFVGTPEYAAPEQFLGQRATPATDVFAVGSLLYFLVMGQAPITFSQRSDPEVCLEQLIGGLPPQLPSARLGQEARRIFQSILERVMRVDPADRWTAQRVLQALEPLARQRASLVDVGPPVARPDALNRDTPTADASVTLADLESPAEVPALDGVVLADRTEWVRRKPRVPSGVAEAVEEVCAVEEPVRRASTPHPSEPRVVPTPQRPTPQPATPPPPPQRSLVPGCLGAMAGMFGIGVAGAGIVALAGCVVAAGVLAAGAWSFGWLGVQAPVVVLDELVVKDAPAIEASPKLLGAADPEWRSARREIQEALDAGSSALARRCGAVGPVVATLLIGPDGTIEAASADVPGADCVEANLKGRSVPNATGVRVSARVGLFIGG
jgi:hypothetical protein